MKKLDDFRLSFGNKELIPIIVGGMGTDISTTKMAIECARLGGICHISDSICNAVVDRHYKTNFVENRYNQYKNFVSQSDKSEEKFAIDEVQNAVNLLVSKTMEQKKGDGEIYINIMEKLSMNNSSTTLKARLNASLDAGIDGISLSAGLHLKSFAMLEDNPRFRHARLGILVSSQRALKIFLLKTKRLRRLPDFIVVEGPLAGGHLGFRMDDLNKINLKSIVLDVVSFLKKEQLDIPVVPAGGLFTGSDAVEMMEIGASAVQVATRFAVTKESGLPDKVKLEYFKANQEDIEVNMVSPAGYPMRMLKNSPCLGSGIRPNCERLGYLLDNHGGCSYIDAYNAASKVKGERLRVDEKTCLCSHMQLYNTWTCGQTTHRLKDTTNRLENGNYQILTTEHVFNDYLHSSNQEICLPSLEEK